MTLDELLADLPPLDELRQLWIVMDKELNDRFLTVQPVYQCQAVPTALTNGDYVLCADLLSDKDTTYAPTFGVLDQSLFPEIPVVEYDLIKHFFPTAPQEP
jgi:hypothetical protein